jgi:hypothetical protein
VGSFAGVTGTQANANQTGASDTFLGANSGPGVDGTTTPINNATAIGANAVVGESNALVLGSINGVNGATSSVNVGIGTATPQTTLDVNGPVRSAPTAFASLPACSSTIEGALRAVSDSTTNTWGGTISGGGSDHVLAYCDGTNWTVAAK